MKLTKIPVGLDEKFYRAGDQEVMDIRKKYSLPDEFIYYPANPWRHKNHARLMAALRIYGDCFGEIPWLVLSGRLLEEQRDAMSLAIAAGVDHRVIDLGFVPIGDLQGLYSAARMMVFPSLFEGFGMPLVEAMACGCPIVAANATTIPEVTNDAALLFDPMDPAEISESIHQIMIDKSARDLLVEKGYRQLDRFSWKFIVPDLLDFYANTLR